MEFPRQQTPEQQVRYLGDLNARLGDENDNLRRQNDRLRAEVTKLKQTGKALVRDAQKFHSNAEDLKAALNLRNQQYQLALNQVEELSNRLSEMQNRFQSGRSQVIEIKNLSGDIHKRIAPHHPIPIRRGPQQSGNIMGGTRWI